MNPLFHATMQENRAILDKYNKYGFEVWIGTN